ncbi:lipase 1 [Longimycelium tulufanense]|uniref:Lipase 1 n=1 Tax=Longimycelium tulufanense TaxID=907463 RepID=A0A8J3FU68_9PSEU|nr:SGNH/GDSL hydrolase family protein [Longimycelium tulufanense]GGM56021.1 lipase 1 [Longimycelium tulufanense]
MRSIRSVLRLSLALLVPAASVLVAAPAQAVEVRYVALGDSFSSGLGTRDYIPESGDCRRSTKAYPALWARNNGVTSFEFVACSGATANDVRTGQLNALNSATGLVTVSVGGTDAGFTETMTTCQIGSDVQCNRAVDNSEQFIRNELPSRLDTVYAAIRERAPAARVVVVGYPRLFEMGPCNIFGAISEARRTRLNEVADALAGVVGGRAAAAGFDFLDARARFAGHGVCSQNEWINRLSWPVNESYHPNLDGHANGYLPELTDKTRAATTAR